MSKISFSVIDQTLICDNTPEIFSGGTNTDIVAFTFDAAWSDYTKTAVFYKDRSEPYYQILNNNVCLIPKEILSDPGKIKIGVFGTNGTQVITSAMIAYDVSEGAVSSDLFPTDPTPDLWAQILNSCTQNVGAINRAFMEFNSKTETALATFNSKTETALGNFDTNNTNAINDMVNSIWTEKVKVIDTTISTKMNEIDQTVSDDLNTFKSNTETDIETYKTEMTQALEDEIGSLSVSLDSALAQGTGTVVAQLIGGAIYVDFNVEGITQATTYAWYPLMTIILPDNVTAVSSIRGLCDSSGGGPNWLDHGSCCYCDGTIKTATSGGITTKSISIQSQENKEISNAKKTGHICIPVTIS